MSIPDEGGAVGRAFRADAELSWATAQLANAGIDSAAVDARWLLSATLGVDRGQLVAIDELDREARERFRAAVQQRATRIPLQHIVGNAAFGPVELAVGPGVFIPRPETECLLEWAVARARELPGPITVVDLCSGSGALAIALAVVLPTAKVHAVERSPAALEWLRRNVEAAGPAVYGRIEVHAADVTDDVQMRAAIPFGSADVVVANPPYVPSSSAISPEAAHDPADAVFGGPDGTAVVAPMMQVVGELLAPGGVVGMEHDDTATERVMSVVAAVPGMADVRSHRDLAGRPRFVTARRMSDVAQRHGSMAE